MSQGQLGRTPSVLLRPSSSTNLHANFSAPPPMRNSYDPPRHRFDSPVHQRNNSCNVAPYYDDVSGFSGSDTSLPRRACDVTLRRQPSLNHASQQVRSLLVIGGIDTNSCDSDNPGRCVLEYQPWQNKWVLLTTLSQPLHHHCAVFVRGKVIVIG